MRLRRRRNKSEAPAALDLSDALSLLPDDGDVAGLLRNVEAERGREIVLLKRPMPVDAPSGLWVSVPDRDYVVVPEAAPHSRLGAIVCHEIAHMLLGHRGEADLRAADLAPDIDKSVVARFLGRHGYEADQEREAESLGTLLAAEAARRARLTPGADILSARLR